jgi:hypothetical protein
MSVGDVQGRITLHKNNTNIILSKNFIIGALHFMPLIGYEGYTDYKTIFNKAKKDLKAFQEGGIHAVILENNYNLPHKIKEDPEAVKMMSDLAKDLAIIASVPLGISVLWNDFESAFKIAKEAGAKFIRVPVFVDDVRTSFGEIIANSKSVISIRNALDCENIQMFADLHVKHAEMIDNKKTFTESATQAQKAGADALIVTGKWTGNAPLLSNLLEVRKAVGEHIPILIGSGADKNNIKELLMIADGAIVSTSLKDGESIDQSLERNLKPYNSEINRNRVVELMNSLTKL